MLPDRVSNPGPSHQHIHVHHSVTRQEKQRIDPATPGLIVQHVIHFTTAALYISFGKWRQIRIKKGIKKAFEYNFPTKTCCHSSFKHLTEVVLMRCHNTFLWTNKNYPQNILNIPFYLDQ